MNKVSMLILGLIQKEPRSAYDLVKTVHTMGIDSMFLCGESTIYIYSKKLMEKGLLEGEEHTQGAKKTIYRIKEEGKRALAEAIEETTIHYQQEDAGFTIAVIFLDLFPVDKMKELLQERIQSIEDAIQGLEQRLQILKEIKELPEYHEYCIKRLIRIAGAELQSVQELLLSI